MIKDKNIDPSANFPATTVALHTCGTATTANTTAIDVWIAPWAGKVVKASLGMISSTSATGTIDVWKKTTAAATTGTSIFAAAVTMATTASLVTDATSQLATTAANYTFAAGDVLALHNNNAAITKPSAYLLVRPLLAKELEGY